MSAWTCSSQSCSSAAALSMRMKRVSHGTSRAKASKRSSAAGSRSMQISVPAGPMRSATSRAWPPSPKVQSMAVSPGRGSSRSISSPARTGTWVRVMSRRMAKALRDLDDLAIQFLLVRVPAGAVPDLDVVQVAHHHDLLLDPRVLEQLLPERHATGRVELHVPGVPREVAREAAALLGDRIEVAEEAVGEGLEGLRRPDRHAGLERLRENHSVGERGAELGGHVQPLLCVERVVELPAEGQCVLRLPYPFRSEVSCGPRWRSGRSPATPVRSRCRHSTPLRPTLQHICPLFPSERVEGGEPPTPKPLLKRVCGRVEGWVTSPPFAVERVHPAVLHGQLRPKWGSGRCVAGAPGRCGPRWDGVVAAGGRRTRVDP